MLSKVFKIDVSTCEKCGGEMEAICAVQKPEAIKRYLAHIGIDYKPPARGPPLLKQESFDFDQSEGLFEDPVICIE